MTLEESKIEIQDIIDIYEKEDMYPLLNDRQISALKVAISALQAQEELYVYSQCKTCRYYHDDDVRCMICDDENDMYEGQEAKTQLSREDTTLGVQKTCITCKHYPPESKWPCIDCDMRNPADRWEPQELSKNSTELDKENGELHPTCTGSEELKQEVKNSTESSSTHKALDTISRQAAIELIHALYPSAPIMRRNRELWEEKYKPYIEAEKALEQLPSAQPEPSEITDEQAILHLQSTGWMQNHDREMYESGLREQLADDSGSYDSLIPYEDTISRQAAISELMEWVEKEKNKSWSPFKGLFHWTGIKAMLECLPPAQPEPLTDKEQRIFLAAMGREEKVCEEVDRNYVREPYEDSLVRVCKEIRRKVKGALWI